MGEIASRGQLRMAFLRWLLVTVPLIVLLGFLSGMLARSGDTNLWFARLTKPELMPPGVAFSVAWTLLYILMGVALALVLSARGARLRGVAIALFVVQLALNLAWSPLFFAAHQVVPALALIAVLFVTVALTVWAFARVRPLAAWLLVPYLLWLLFAAYLNYGIVRLNPDAATLAPGAANTQIRL